MFKKGTKAHAIFLMIEAALLIVVGILALAFRTNTDAYSITFIVAGVLIIVSASFGILADVIMTMIAPNTHMLVMSKTGSIVANAVELALGIAFCVAGAQFKDYGGAEILAVFNFIALMIGLILVVAGGIYFIYATTYVVRAPKEAKIGCLAPYIVAAVLIALGVVTLVLIWNSNELMKLIFVIAGIILLVVGALYLISGILELLGKGGKEEVVAEATVEETTAE